MSKNKDDAGLGGAFTQKDDFGAELAKLESHFSGDV